MAVVWNTVVPPWPLTGGFTADAATQAPQELVVKLSLSPGTYQLSVLPDLMVLTTASGAPTPLDYSEFLPESLISGAYVKRTVNWYDAYGAMHTGDVALTSLHTEQDTLAIEAARNTGAPDLQLTVDPTFLTGQVTIEAAKTIAYPSGARDVYTADYYLVIDGWNTSYPLGLTGADVASSGRFLVTSGNPTGQRTAAWGDQWLNVQSVFQGYQPPDVPPLPTPAPVTDLDPHNLPALVNWGASDDGACVQSPPIADTAGAEWWNNFGKTVLSGYASQALTALKELANGLGHPNVGAALDVVNAGTTALGVRDFLNGLVEKIWAHDAEGMQLALNPNTTSAQVYDWFSRGEKIASDAQQGSRDQAISIVADQVVTGGGTVYSVWTSIPKVASQENSFTLGLGVPGVQVTGGARTDVIWGGTDADTIRAGAGNDMVLGFAGNDVIDGGDGRDLLWGGTGNDQIDGGAGVDTAFFSGARSGYAITKTAAGFSVSMPGSAGALTNVERLQFSDMNVALDIDGTGGQAYRLYQAAFNRTPDMAGLGFWIKALDGGAVLRDVALGFVQSPEFRSVYGTSPTNAQLVTKYYENVLHRAPEPGGYAYWLGILDQHLDTAAGVLANISESPENQAGVIGVIGNGFAYTPYG